MEHTNPNATASSSRPVPLPKGSACLPCRKKKLRCDAKRPICSGCERSHASNRNSHGKEKQPCVWEDQHLPPPTQRRGASEASASARVVEEEEEDEERVGEGRNKKRKGEGRTEGSQQNLHQENVPDIQLYGARPLPVPEICHIDTLSSGLSPSTSSSEAFFFPPSTSSTSTFTPPTTSFQTIDFSPPQPSLHQFSPLLYSGYPSTLPPPHLLFYLVEIFFLKVPTVPKIINRHSFLTSLRTLPPTHPAFPSVAVLHAIVALAVRHCGREELKVEFKTNVPKNYTLGKEDGVNIFESEMESFRGRHARLAKEEIDKLVGGTGEKLFEAVVAAVILEGFDYQEARWVQSWIHSAFSIRLAVPLGLHQASKSLDVFATEVILPRTNDPYELELRRRAFWLGLISDRRASISSKWAHSLSDDDITVGLPTRLDQFQRGPGSNIPLNPQNLASPDLFTYNPPEHTDSFVLNIKSILLLRRTQLLTENLQETHLPLGVDPRSTLSFQEAQRQIERYRDSFSGELSLRDAQGRKGMVDGDLILASTLPHISLIYLHDDYASVLSKGDRSATILLQAARGQLLPSSPFLPLPSRPDPLLFFPHPSAILGSVVSLCSTSYEFGSLPPFLSFCWYIAGRTLTRFYQGLLYISDFGAAEAAMNEIRAFRIGLVRFAANCPLAEKEVGMLDKAIQAASSFPSMGPSEPCTSGLQPVRLLDHPSYSSRPSSSLHEI
ncbi:hypothetical protein BDY24DRAFT_12918 [Mrakia frigida]|uniref:Zn(II)2Cys6 transcription factor n=1 Tax=Mrakia frigida TaxID=29902 RepID=UPI003FCC0E66